MLAETLRVAFADVKRLFNAHGMPRALTELGRHFGPFDDRVELAGGV